MMRTWTGFDEERCVKKANELNSNLFKLVIDAVENGSEQTHF